MKLLIDAHVFDRKFQGVRTYLEGLYSHMTKFRDIDFYFAANRVDILQEAFGEAENIHYIKIKERNQLLRLIYDFPKIITEYKIDCAQFQYMTPLFKRCKEIVNIYDLLIFDFPQFFPLGYRLKLKYLFKRSAKKADMILTISEFSRNSLIRDFNVDRDKIYITPIGVLPAVSGFTKQQLKEKYNLDKYILFVSRVEPRKNHLLLLQAYHELGLSNQGYKLVFIGGKDIHYNEFFSYLNHLPANERDNILMIQVPFNELVSFYQNASLFVYPSLGEGFGIPPIEAIMYGCPLLCSNAPAMSEFGLPEEISFSPSNLAELKIKMMQQLSNPTPPDKYRDEIMERYAWEKIAREFHQELINRNFI